MARLTGSKRVVAIAAAAFMVTAVSGTALAMLDPGLGSLSTQSTRTASGSRASTGRQAEQHSSTFESPAPTPEHPNKVEFRGTVESMATTGWVIAGRTVIVASQTELKGSIDIGSQVKVEGRALPDGSVQAREIKLVTAGDDNDNGNGNNNGNENGNENHNGNVNSNDNDGNGNNNGNENENHNGNVNSNDNGNHNDNGDDHRSNGNGNHNDNGDDHGGNGNGDHNDNGDDHGGSGNGNHNDNGDDHGGNGND